MAISARTAILTGSAALLAVCATEAPGQALPELPPLPKVALGDREWSVPRTPWGEPDLQGAYTNDLETGTPMERPAEFEGLTLDDITAERQQEIVAQRNEAFMRQVNSEAWSRSISPPPHLIFDTYERENQRAWLVIDPPDGRIPSLTEEARNRPRPRGVSTNANPRGPFNSFLDMGLYDRCVTRGLPNSMMPAGYGAKYEIVQSPGVVAIRYEMLYETRVIPINGGSHIDESIRHYMGEARGRWDGDTLIVETRNFKSASAPRNSSENVVMIERFTPTADDTLEWTVTFHDETTWTSPWTFSMPLTRVDYDERPLEYACHEGNYAMRNILSGARAAEAAAENR
jgi:hypothetical protein